MIDQQRTVPHSLTLEQAILGGLMFDNAAWWRVVGIVSDADFYSPRHQVIYRAIRALIDAAKPFDALSLMQYLTENQDDMRAGGQEYIGQILRDSPGSTVNIRSYAEKVRDLSLLRQLVHEADRMSEDAISAAKPAGQIISESSLAISRLAHGLNSDSTAKLLKETAPAWLDDMEEGYKAKGMVGLPIGFHDIDDRTKGLRKGHLVVIAARPSVGKSLFALNCASHMARNGKRILFVSREMEASEIHTRLCAANGRCDHDKLLSCQLDDQDVATASAKYLEMVKQWDFLIDDGNDDSLPAIASTARELHREKPLDALFVDYLQLLRVPGMDPFSTQEVSEVSRALKRLAVEMQIPVIAVAQLNRGVEGRKDMKPRISDLRQSGQIEQDANVIMLLHRDMDENAPQDEAEIIIGKLRHGRRGVVPLVARLDQQRFESAAFGGAQ